MFIIKEVLEIAKKTELTNATKNIYKQPQKRPIQNILKDEEAEVLESESDSSASDYIIVAARRQCLKLKMAEKVAGYAGWPVTREVTLSLPWEKCLAASS